MPAPIRIRREALTTLIEESRRDPSIECCGLLAGTAGVITEILPAPNALASPTAYEIAPEDLFRLFREMRQRGLDHLGIYHSHPATDNAPSPTDIARSFYPDAAYIIVSPRPDAPRPIRAFEIRNGIATESKIVEETS